MTVKLVFLWRELPSKSDSKQGIKSNKFVTNVLKSRPCLAMQIINVDLPAKKVKIVLLVDVIIQNNCI